MVRTSLSTGTTREGVEAVAPASFADARKTAGLLFAAPHPGSVAPEVFRAERDTRSKQNENQYSGTEVAKVSKLELGTPDVILLLAAVLCSCFPKSSW